MLGTSLIPEYPATGFAERGLDLLFPPTCVGCRRTGRWICPKCWPVVDWLPEMRCGLCERHWLQTPCPHCAGQQSSLEGIGAVTVFGGSGREAVHALKYHGKHAIGGMMGKLMARALPELELSIVAPVPLHPKRRRERGYDQAAILARFVSRSLDLAYEPEALRRVRPTRQQTSLDGLARQTNVAGAFTAEPWVEGENVLLIDDVTTTGATLEAAAGALHEAGAVSVFGLVFAAAL